MSGFIDTYPPERFKTFGFQAVPEFSTNLTRSSSGARLAQPQWYTPLHRYTAPGVVDCITVMQEIKDMWMALLGPAYSFPFRDPADFASRPVTRANTAPVVGAGDQFIGVGDGLTIEFQLVKSYVFGSRTVYRPIYLPVVSSVLVAIDGVEVDPAYWSVTRYGGRLTFGSTVIPEEGEIVTAGFLFDVEVAFEDDNAYQQIVRAFGAEGVADLTFVELRPCAAGV